MAPTENLRQKRIKDFKKNVLPFIIASEIPSVASTIEGLFNDLTLPFLCNLDQIGIPTNAIEAFELSFEHKSAISRSTKSVMTEALRLKNPNIYSWIVPDDKVIQVISLWNDTLAGTDEQTLDKYDFTNENYHLFRGKQSLLSADDRELTFVGNPNDIVSPIFQTGKEKKSVMAKDLLIEQLTHKYNLTETEIKVVENKISTLPYAVVHLDQIATNGLSTFTLRVGDLTTTEIVSFGVNGWYRPPSQQESRRVRIVYESPDKPPKFYEAIGYGEVPFTPTSAEKLEIQTNLEYREGSKDHMITVKNQIIENLLHGQSTSFLDLSPKFSYQSIGF